MLDVRIDEKFITCSHTKLVGRQNGRNSMEKNLAISKTLNGLSSNPTSRKLLSSYTSTNTEKHVHSYFFMALVIKNKNKKIGNNTNVHKWRTGQKIKI